MFCFFISVQHESCPNCPNKVDALNTKFTETYKKQKFKPYSVDGQVAGQYKNAGSFSYLRVYGAGHEVPAYKVCIEFFFYIVQRLTIYKRSMVIWIMVKRLPNFSPR